MFSITASELLNVLVDINASKEFELRDVGFSLIKPVTRHEIEILAVRDWVCGQMTKRGLRYVQLTVESNRAMRLLKRLVARSGRVVAEACATIDKTTAANGNVIYSHRDDVHRTWSRKQHWSNWGARGRGAKAVVIVPVQKKKGRAK